MTWRWAVLVCVAFGVGCSSDGGVGADSGPAADLRSDAELYPNQPGGNPLVPEVAGYPYPSDLYLVSDATTRTGRRVEMPQAALPARVPPSVFGGADGFSRITPILTFFPGGIDPASLPGEFDHGATILPSSPVQLLDATTGERVPILPERDLSSPLDTMRALIIRPLRALAPNHGYVVVVTKKLRDAAGQPLAPNAAQRALLEGTPTTVEAIERQRKSFELVTATLAKASIDKGDVVQAWSFHTRSEGQATAPLLAMQDMVMKQPLPNYTITSDTVDADLNRQLVATFEGPRFISPITKKIELDAQGVPKQFGTASVEFGLTIPDSVDGPRPLILYGHGFLGSWKQGTRGSFNELCRKHRFSALTSFFGFNETFTTRALTILTAQMGEIDQINAEVLQTFVNYTMLGRLAREKLAQELKKTVGSQEVGVIDGSAVHYMGVSNGGTFGYVVAATQPELERAVLVVGGGGLIHFLQRSVVYNGYQPFFKLLLPNPLELQLALAALQTSLDPIDSMNYVQHLVHDRFSGRKPLRAAMHIAIHDSQVDNLVSEWIFRSAKVPIITPSPKAIWGAETITAPAPEGAPAGTLAGVFVYDEQVEPPPAGNVPPEQDNDTHGTVTKLDAYHTHVAEFLNTGKFIQVCQAACDPE